MSRDPAKAFCPSDDPDRLLFVVDRWPGLRAEHKEAWRVMAGMCPKGSARLTTSYAELMAAMKIGVSSVHRRLSGLAKQGLIQWQAGDGRIVVLFVDPFSIVRPPRNTTTKGPRRVVGGEANGQLFDDGPPSVRLLEDPDEAEPVPDRPAQAEPVPDRPAQAEPVPDSSESGSPPDADSQSLPRAEQPGGAPPNPLTQSSSPTTTTYTRTNERTDEDFARAYTEGFGPAFLRFAGKLNADGKPQVFREPKRRERFELMRLAVIACEQNAIDSLLQACEITRKVKVESDAMNYIKGTFANLAGIPRDDLFRRLDGMEVPERFLRAPDAAPNGEYPQRE